MDKQRFLRTMQIYEGYEKRFLEAQLKSKSGSKDKAEITERVKKMLAYDESLIPTIGEFEEISCAQFDGYSVTELRYETWSNFYGAASLYMPNGDGKYPLVFIFCGHGKNGRLSNGYMAMAHRLASAGFAVMVPDNIGQGDRKAQGHWDVTVPFHCGLTVQGLIIMESVALIRKMASHKKIDSSRMGACGNSGGGTLCLFLAAFAKELAVLSSSGYPSDFSYLLSKERPHCACNLLRGCACGPEMWEILSLFAPKPLLIEQGENDHLIPLDHFWRTARKLRFAYSRLDAEENFEHALAKSNHPWIENDRRIISAFLAKHLGAEAPSDEKFSDTELEALAKAMTVPLPEGSLDTDSLAKKLSDANVEGNPQLHLAFKPTFNGETINEEDVIPDIGRGSVMRIWAQMEFALLEE